MCLIGGHGVKRAVTRPRPREGRPDAPSYRMHFPSLLGCSHFPSLIHHLVGRGLEHVSVLKKNWGSSSSQLTNSYFFRFFQRGRAQPPSSHCPIIFTSFPIWDDLHPRLLTDASGDGGCPRVCAASLKVSGGGSVLPARGSTKRGKSYPLVN